MERKTTVEEAKIIMGDNFIGVEELKQIDSLLPIFIPTELPNIPFSRIELENKKNEYFLILGLSYLKNGNPINLMNIRELFGINPNNSEPCFYNQDWYLNENFMSLKLETDWYLIKKTLIDSTRAIQPTTLEKEYTFPRAVLCAYSFFVIWFIKNEILWKNDFVWCDDFDNSGDRIYVGRYYDKQGLSKNGFSIHRHLSIRSNYGTI